MTLAWESNVRSAAHSNIQRLSDEEQETLKSRYLDALAREENEQPGALKRAGIIYALGRR